MNPLPGRAFLIRGSLATRADLPRRDGSRFSEPRIRKASYLTNRHIIYYFDTKVNVWHNEEKRPKTGLFGIISSHCLSKSVCNRKRAKGIRLYNRFKIVPFNHPCNRIHNVFCGPVFPDVCMNLISVPKKFVSQSVAETRPNLLTEHDRSNCFRNNAVAECSIRLLG